jgi:hypothetical protein
VLHISSVTSIVGDRSRQQKGHWKQDFMNVPLHQDCFLGISFNSMQLTPGRRSGGSQ